MEQICADGTRIYRPSKRDRTFFAVLGCFTIIAGVWLESKTLPAAIDAIRQGSSRTSPSCFLAVIGCFFVVGGILQIRVYWKRILMLTADTVKVEFIYGLRGMKFTDILGRRSRATQYGKCTVVVPKTKRLRELVIKEGFVVDDFYQNWLASLPDLDAADKEQRRAAGKLHFWES